MSKKKWCVRFKQSAAGRRCAKYDTGSYRKMKRMSKHCKEISKKNKKECSQD